MGKITPKYRYKLKARIFEAGFKTVQEFAAAAGTDPSRVSRVIGGWEFPSDCLARSMADALRVSAQDLEQML
jgi:hypothetical protein